MPSRATTPMSWRRCCARPCPNSSPPIPRSCRARWVPWWHSPQEHRAGHDETNQEGRFPRRGPGHPLPPATKTVQKEMLPIVDRPLIQYAVDEAIEAGCDTLIFVTNRYKHAVAAYFDKTYELEQKLEKTGQHRQLDPVRNVLPEGVHAVSVTQATELVLVH